MMHSILRNISILSLALIVGGCAGNSPPSRFYLLSAMAPTDAAPHSTTVVGVGPVRLPGYLERDQIVSRSNTNSLRVDEFDRWGGALDRNVADVVAENLSRLLGTEGVVVYPWSSAIRIDFQVALDIRAFESLGGTRINLIAQWRLFRGDSEELITIRRAEITERLLGEGYNNYVAAQSRALAALSEKIAQSIQASHDSS